MIIASLRLNEVNDFGESQGVNEMPLKLDSLFECIRNAAGSHLAILSLPEHDESRGRPYGYNPVWMVLKTLPQSNPDFKNETPVDNINAIVLQIICNDS
jgi:hypothetical protein